MADVTGPISTLPGSTRSPPEGAMCDEHPERPAVRRVQGETDSFGSEMHDLCEECLQEDRAYRRSPEATTGRCDWCKNEAADLRPRRDYEEGMGGPVYEVCGACAGRSDERIAQELESFEGPLDFVDYDDRLDDEYDQDDDDPGDECGRWENGTLGKSCRLAGTEFCDFDCPYADGSTGGAE